MKLEPIKQHLKNEFEITSKNYVLQKLILDPILTVGDVGHSFDWSVLEKISLPNRSVKN